MVVTGTVIRLRLVSLCSITHQSMPCVIRNFGLWHPLGSHDDVKVIFCGRALKEENHNIGLPPQLESVRVRHDIFSQSVSQSRNSEEAVEKS